MAATGSNLVFDAVFIVQAIDKEGKKFDRVSRLYAKSANFDLDLTLDYNIELFPLKEQQEISLALASSLLGSSSGTGDADEEEKDRPVWRPDGKGKRGLEQEYEYVMYGKVNHLLDVFGFPLKSTKVYKFDSGTKDIVTAYASFGGLLMSLTGHVRHMTNIVLGDPVYLLVRKH